MAKFLGMHIPFTNDDRPARVFLPTNKECIAHELSLPENAATRASFVRHNVTLGELAPDTLLDDPKYDDVGFSRGDGKSDFGGARIVSHPGGSPTWCYTVGEYKAATKKNDDKWAYW